MLTMDDIVREGDPILEKRAAEVESPISEQTKRLLLDMRQFLINSQDEAMREKYALREGVGLSGPQVGFPKRLVAIYTLDEKFETLHDYMLINPRIVSHSVVTTYMPGGEGCLSVDREVEGLVPRYRRVTVKSWVYEQDADRIVERELRLRNFASIVIQHEIDHLDGVLFTERVVPSLEGISPIEFKTEETDNTKEESAE